MTEPLDVVEVRLKQMLPLPGAASARLIEDGTWQLDLGPGYVVITKTVETDTTTEHHRFVVPLSEVAMMRCAPVALAKPVSATEPAEDDEAKSETADGEAPKSKRSRKSKSETAE